MSTAVDLLLDCENGADGDGITALNAEAGSHHGSLAGAWTTSTGLPLTAMKVSTADDQGALGRIVSVAGTDYPGSGGSRGWRYDHSVASGQFANFRPTVSPGLKATAGFYFKTQKGGTFTLADLVYFEGLVAGVACVFQLRDYTGTNFGIECEGSSPVAGTTHGTLIQIAENTRYWGMVKYDGNAGVVAVRVYNPATWTIVGVESTSAVDTADNIKQIRIGCNFHGSTPPTLTKIDNLIIDFTGAQWPIGLPLPSSRGGGLTMCGIG